MLPIHHHVLVIFDLEDSTFATWTMMAFDGPQLIPCVW
jgi:hypothetical protein